MGRRNTSIAYAAAVSSALILFGCTSFNEVATVMPEEDGMSTAEFNELAQGREGLILLLEETRPSNGTQIEASADSLFWTDDAGQRKRSSLGDVHHVDIVSNSAGFWEGAKLGAAVGIAGGVGVAGSVTSSSESAEARTMAPLAYFFYPALGGIVGGVAGGIYGSATGHTFHCSFRPRGSE